MGIITDLGLVVGGAVVGHYAHRQLQGADQIAKSMAASLVMAAEEASAQINKEMKSNKESEKTTERVIDESEVPEKVLTHLTAEEQKEKLLEAIASENDAAKRAELIKQLKALKCNSR